VAGLAGVAAAGYLGGDLLQHRSAAATARPVASPIDNTPTSTAGPTEAASPPAAQSPAGSAGPTGPAKPTSLPSAATPARAAIVNATPTATHPAPAATQVAARATPTTIARTRQPNVILITVDTLRADRLGAYGFAQAHTPTLDRFASEGIRFDHAICQLPQTNASHAALLTGLYPSTNGLKIHMVDHIKSGVPTMASVFANAGYRTAGIYSWVSLDPQFCGLNAGFQTYEGYVLNRSLVFSNPQLEQIAAWYRQIKSQVPVIQTADLALNSSQDFESTLDGRADVTNAAVFHWLDNHPTNEPFFLWVHYFDPHYPYNPPAGFDHLFGLKYSGAIDGSVATIHELEDNQRKLSDADVARLGELYQGEISYVDSQIGSLFQKLQSMGLADDTIMLLTGDHGESFGEHGDWVHGTKVYESEIRVPLVVRYPRQVPAGGVVRVPVQSIDVLPTVLQLTGITPPKALQGQSFASLLKKPTDSPARVAFTELADESFVSLLTAEWKLIRNNANGELQLYHLSQDESEANEVSASQGAVTRNLGAQLQDYMKFSGVSH
jgi:arylsulfatase A-like enzyme